MFINGFKKKVSIMIFASCFFAFAGCVHNNLQKNQNNTQGLPFSEKITKGRLKNGLTYYLVKNKYPEKRVEFRLNVRTGSLNETDEEQGLAHFVEHMAFNGTKHFKHNELVEFLEDAGLTFGKHSNAYTSTNVTNYQLSIPSKRKDLIDKAYLIISDWADGLLFNEDEIEKEKGVITEEWRMRKSANSRLGKQLRKVTMAGSRYITRDPIGKMEVVQGADRKLLKGYYDKWYTPENMSVIIVGDIDVKETERKVIDLYSKIKSRKTPKKADDRIPHVKGLRIAVATDPEASGIRVSFNHLFKSEKTITYPLYRESLKRQIAMSLFSKRINRKISDKKVPMIRCFAIAANLVPETDTANFIFIPKNKEVKKGITSLFTEIEQVKRFGYTDVEFDEYIARRIKLLEDYSKPGKRYESTNIANEIIAFDLSNTHLMSPNQQLELFKKAASEINLSDINSAFNQVLEAENRVVTISMPEADKDLAFTKEEILKIIDKVKSSELKPYSLGKAKDKLIDKKPLPGKIISREKLELVDAYSYTFSNNARLIIKETKFTPGMFSLAGMKKGGLSIISDKDFKIAGHAAAIIDRSGFEGIPVNDIPRILAGKNINVSPNSGGYSYGFTGGGSSEEAELLFQMLHLYITRPVVDENALSNYKAYLKQMIKIKSKNKMFNFFKNSQEKIYNENFRPGNIELEEVDLLTKEKIITLYKEMFGDINNFTFTITGDVDREKIAELGRIYIGSLKAKENKSDYLDRQVRLKPNTTGENILLSGGGEIENRATIKMRYESDADFSIENTNKLLLLKKILSAKLRVKIREEKGGVYSIGAYLRMTSIPSNKYTGLISFTCDPARAMEITKEVEKILKDFADNGVKESELEKAKKQTLTEIDTAVKLNAYWLNGISTYTGFGWPLEKMVQKDEIIKNTTKKEIDAIAAKYLKPGSGYTLIFAPEKIGSK